MPTDTRCIVHIDCKVVHIGEVGWYIPAIDNDIMEPRSCPRCGDQNYDEHLLCLTCTYGDADFRNGMFRDGWKSGYHQPVDPDRVSH